MADQGSVARQLLKDNGREVSPAAAPATPPAEGQPAAAPASPAEGQPATPPAEGQPAAAPPAAPPKKNTETGAQTDENNQGANPPADKNTAVLDDEAVKTYLKSRGIEVDKIEDLAKPKPAPTDKEIEASKEDLKRNVLKFGLENKLVKAADLENYTRDTAKTPKEIVLPVLAEKWRKADPDLTDDDIADRFSDLFKEKLKDDHWERVERQSELQAMADNILYEKYENVISLENQYTDHVQTLDRAKDYNQQVTGVFASLPTEIPFELEIDAEGGKKEKKSYKYAFPAEDIAAVKEQFLTPDSFKRLGREKVDDKVITDIVRNALIVKNLDKIVTTIARGHSNEMVQDIRAGRKGIPPAQGGDGASELTNIPKRTAAHEMLEANKR